MATPCTETAKIVYGPGEMGTPCTETAKIVHGPGEMGTPCTKTAQIVDEPGKKNAGGAKWFHPHKRFSTPTTVRSSLQHSRSWKRLPMCYTR